ncbi:hypothetical protein H1R20_g6095, partial [Candolleomyces eurysporus]
MSASHIELLTNARNFSVNHLTFNTICSDIDAQGILEAHAARGAMYDSNERYPAPLCHPGTRQIILGRITIWYHGRQRGMKKSIMWVHAPAGYGKSATAQTVAEDLEKRFQELGFNPLGATFFFWRGSPERSNPTRFVITLAYQLAMSIPELSPHIEDAVKRHRTVLSKTMEAQLEKLIIEPFRSLDNLEEMPNRLVIIDGLDECINSDEEHRGERQYAEGQERVQVRVLGLIHKLQSHNFPLSFLILSRPEPWIKQHVETRPWKDITETEDLYLLEDHVKDVETFVRAELERIASAMNDDLGESEEQWPGESRVRRLLRQSDGHMLYASVVMKHIEDPFGNPKRLLGDILDRDYSSLVSHVVDPQSFSTLHKLYMQILRACPERVRPGMVEVLQEMLNVESRGLLYRMTPAKALDSLDRLSHRESGSAMRTLRGLHALLHLSNTPSDSFFVHRSIVEFLTTPELALEFTLKQEFSRKKMIFNGLDYISSVTPLKPGDQDLLAMGVEFGFGSWAKSDESMTETENRARLEKLLSIDLAFCIVGTLSASGSTVYAGEVRHQKPTMIQSILRTYKEFKRPGDWHGLTELAVKGRHHIELSISESCVQLLSQGAMVSGLGWFVGSYMDMVDWKDSRVVDALATMRSKHRASFDAIKRSLTTWADLSEDSWKVYNLLED